MARPLKKIPRYIMTTQKVFDYGLNKTRIREITGLGHYSLEKSIELGFFRELQARRLHEASCGKLELDIK